MQFSLMQSDISGTRGYQFLSKMDNIIPWDQLVSVIEPHFAEKLVGRKPYPLKLKLKMLFLQDVFNLSDEAMEDQIYDRLSFQNFLELNPALDDVPDATTILLFRKKLDQYKLREQIFHKIKNKLIEQNYLLKRGSIVDATIIQAPSSTKNAEQARDPEMSSTKKNNQYHFGMKVHIAVDEDSGLVHTVTGTTAKVADISQIDELMHGEEEYILGDRGYDSKTLCRKLRQAGIHYGITRKRDPKRELSRKQKLSNAKHTNMRKKVEHVFGVVKRLWGHSKVRYKGLEKNIQHFFGLMTWANLYRVEYVLNK